MSAPITSPSKPAQKATGATRFGAIYNFPRAKDLMSIKHQGSSKNRNKINKRVIPLGINILTFYRSNKTK
jgi:hypothetical protein